MWKDPDPDPGGEPPESATKISRELSDLKDENEQQKVLIAQLKEMLRKEQSNVPHEKIDEYVNTLTKMTAKKLRGKMEESSSTNRPIPVESAKTERLNLLKQQLEQNKAKLAERGKSQKGMEDMVTQLKAELNDSQQLINSAPMLLVDPKTLDYSKSTNPEELYNILIMKEQKISELISKTQRQEGKILDLQENLKEKDSVIDARTKAITLMTDSLSKKGKTTLDALDETKEQMKKMQEDFITLESEMKARQLKLLEELKAKNLEIQDLQDLNQKLENQVKLEQDAQVQPDILVKKLQEQLEVSKQENDKHLEKIANLNKQLHDNMEDIKILKSTGVSEQKLVSNDDEVNKLKKQLEESNKSMIKIKAQSKSKIKDLTKKLEAFKKMSDANTLIAELQIENTKLSEKVAELEEEKGNLQLNMVESSDSIKDTALAEENKELQQKISINLENLKEKDKVISLLEGDIASLKEEINTLNSKVFNLSHLENVQVTSEMKSIQIEEQLDELENENIKLKEEIATLEIQRRELREKIDELLKEKQELSTKLDNYIQENMDLIDKLEKLSAEKVSSAESIEIVEGLTQQEKLELAAYQKSLDVNLEEPIKVLEDQDIALESPPELNESVHQLTEDSAELLRKIEMFNAERKEVMIKMEALKEENNTLSLKVHEIENNRDILADTYEHLQNEKEAVSKEKENLEEKLRILESGSDNKAVSLEDSDVASQLHALQANYEKLLEENNSLKANIKNFDTIIHEKHHLESQIVEYRKKIDVLETKLHNSLQDLRNYEAIIEDNKNELISSANTINNLEINLNDRETEINELNVLINDLNNVVKNLQDEKERITNLELMETKFEELKTTLNKQIEEAQDYAEEVEHNKTVITELNENLLDMNKKILDTVHELEMKDIEIEKLKHEIINRDDAIKSCEFQILERDEKLKIVTSDMKERFLALQKQLGGNNSFLEQQIEDLTGKNKEQLEKMKKIAANLKKKNQAYQKLEATYRDEKEKWEIELKEKETLICQVKELKEEVDQKNNKLEESEGRIRELSDIVQNLEQDLENSMIEMRRKQEKLHEVSLKQELSTSLHEEFDLEHGTNDSTKEDKIKELELIIETNESELSHFKERLQKLEEELEKSLEDREQIDMKAASLENQLNLVSRNIEEKKLLEEELGQKLQQVSANDELLVRKLEETNIENNELMLKSREQEETINKLKVKLTKAHGKVTQLKFSQQALEELENANNELKKQLAHLESAHRHTQEENEVLQKKNQSEYDKIESDYQIQLEELVRVRNELMVECEKLKEDLKVGKDKEEELLEENGELKLKADEFDRLTVQWEKMSQNFEEVTSNRNALLNEIENLNITLQSHKFEINDLNNQLLKKTAEETIEEVVTLATDHILSMNSKETQTENEIIVEDLKPEVAPKFQWPDAQEIPQEENLFGERAFIQTRNPFVIKASQQLGLPSLLYDIESQVLSANDIVDASNNKKALQEIEFENVDPSFGTQSQAVVEDLMKPKQAFLTYQPGVGAFGENDDGWGWCPEESRLEEEHQSLAENTPHVQKLKLQLVKATEKLRVLELERENHLEQIKQLQVKSGKLIKKCKELKAQNCQLLALKEGKKSTDDFFDLNDTIQEELKSQIAHLEKRIKEITSELEKERAEKKSILNRVDVLTAANERMIEMKEIQDAEVLRWKRKYEEIEQRKLQQNEWGSDGFSERPPTKHPVASEDVQTVEDLQKIIKELSLDNEELQTLLNEQRELRIQAEKSKVPSIPPELLIKINNLEHELTVRNGEIQAVLEEKSNLIDSLQAHLSQKESVIGSLEEEIYAKTKEFDEMTVELKNLQTLSDSTKSELEERIQIYRDLKHSFDQLKTVGTNIIELKECLQQLKEEKLTLETVLNEKDNQLREVYNQLNADTSRTSDIEELKYKLQETVKEKIQLESLVAAQNSNLDQLKSELDVITSKLLQTEDTKTHLEDLIRDRELSLENLKVEESKYVEENAQLSQYKEAKVQLEALITEKDAALNQYKAAYDQLMVLNDSLTKQNECLNNDMDDLKNKLGNLQEENKKQQHSFNQLDTEKSNTVEALEKTLEEMRQKQDEYVDRVSPNNDKLAEELIILKTQKQEVDSEVERLRIALDGKQREFESVIADLETKCAAQVDERGNTVAESWKYHLGIVEAEFATVQEKLKKEMNELEGKCDALVNENNELRKNVDAEIRNEVDKISALQHQINEKQQIINDLSLELGREQQEVIQLKGKIVEMGNVGEKEEEIKRLKLILETTQQQFDEKREVLEEIVKILELSTPQPITLQKEDVLHNFNHQLRKIAEYENEILRLRDEIEELKTTSIAIKETQVEVTHLKQTINDLQRLDQEKDDEVNRLSAEIQNLEFFKNAYQDKEAEIVRLNELVGNLQFQSNNLQENDIEIAHLKQNVDNLQNQLSLISEKEKEVIDLNATIEDYQKQIHHLHQNVSILQEEKASLTYYIEDSKRQLEESLQAQTILQNTVDQHNQQILSLNQQLQQFESYKNDANKNIEELQVEIAHLKRDSEIGRKSLTECQQQLFTTMQELSDKAHAFNEVVQQLNSTQGNVDVLEQDLLNLKQSLELKEREYSESIENLKKARLTDVETHYEEVLAAKDFDLQTAKAHLQQSLQQSQVLSEKLDMENRVRAELEAKTVELEGKVLNLEDKLSEQLKLMEEEEKQLEEMRGIIEEQVVKIEELKKELFAKSNDYDSLVAEMDMGRKNLTQVTQVGDASASTSKSSRESETEDPSEAINRAELDLALYMLHQRDVRCEELTVELTQLLEERDTLQLRLSNVIREKEELRRKAGVSSEVVATTSTSNQEPSTSTKSKSSQVIPVAAGAELTTEALEAIAAGEQDLANKLSELKITGYKKDKTFVDEQQLRRLQQMSIMQQHIKEAAKLPPEAAAKLVDACYTLSRDVQSPSKVILNWLWGRSTPRQNDT